MATGFRAALETHFAHNRAHPQHAVWLDYAASTNERGQGVVAKVREFRADVRGLRWLDIGSGYGGVCIAAAKAGAVAVGIEVDPSLLALADANRRDHPGLDVRFEPTSALDWDTLSTWGSFDVITCDNVVEHVPNPPVMLVHLARLLAPGGLVYLTVPNAFSLGQVVKECHYSRFGLSLLDPIDGQRYVKDALGNDSYDVAAYYRLPEYVALLERYGLSWAMLNPVEAGDEEVRKIRAALSSLEQARAQAEIPVAVRAKVNAFVDAHLAWCRAELGLHESLPPGAAREELAHRMAREWLQELWYFVARPLAQVPVEAPTVPAPAPLDDLLRALRGVRSDVPSVLRDVAGRVRRRVIP